jgi:Family of unknown function (DUF6334)
MMTPWNFMLGARTVSVEINGKIQVIRTMAQFNWTGLRWGWITINQQDALDGILISFGGISPQVMLNVIASSIKESVIQKPTQS